MDDEAVESPYAMRGDVPHSVTAAGPLYTNSARVLKSCMDFGEARWQNND
jgi:hypothetical protein